MKSGCNLFLLPWMNWSVFAKAYKFLCYIDKDIFFVNNLRGMGTKLSFIFWGESEVAIIIVKYV